MVKVVFNLVRTLTVTIRTWVFGYESRMVDGKLHLLVFPDVHVVHFFTEAHVFAGLHVVVQILALILHLVFEDLLLLSFV